MRSTMKFLFCPTNLKYDDQNEINIKITYYLDNVQIILITYTSNWYSVNLKSINV